MTPYEIVSLVDELRRRRPVFANNDEVAFTHHMNMWHSSVEGIARVVEKFNPDMDRYTFMKECDAR